MEERRVSLDEKAQVMEMVKAGIYTPRTARRLIEKIDKRARPPTLHCGDAYNSLMRIQSPSGSHSRSQTRSPSPDRRSLSWDIEDPDHRLDEIDKEI